MKRREFITLLGGAAAASPGLWPVAARAQQPDRMRRVGVLMNLAGDDPAGQARLIAFAQGLQALGWTAGRNVRIDTRWSSGESENYRKYALELLALSPDVILASTSTAVAALQKASRNVPIVFVSVIDPVGAGLVASLARPGGNSTGFAVFEYGLSAKWLELLKQVAPNVTRAAILRNSATPTGIAQLAAIQSMAPSLGVELSPIGLQDAGGIEREIGAFADKGPGGLVVPSSSLAIGHRDLIVALAARYRLPTVYPFRLFVSAGGLISYGPDLIEPYRQAAGYVDRILKGERPADLPVQAPVRYETVLNLRTAKALGLELPATVLARADEVIE